MSVTTLDPFGLEERLINAWPAPGGLMVDGWILRLAGGPSRRANSVNPYRPGGTLAPVIAAAESLYPRHGRPSLFRLTPLAPAGTEQALEAAGYRCDERCPVFTAALTAANAIPDPDVILSAVTDSRWRQEVAAVKGLSVALAADHDRQLDAILPAATLARLEIAGRSVAWGLAVAERGAVGLFDIVTDETLRGRGFGQRLVQALLAWGRDQGAEGGYLQVGEHNAGAQRLYRRLGFDDAYRYDYWVKDPRRG